MAELLFALALAVFIVWWTMFSGRKKRTTREQGGQGGQHGQGEHRDDDLR